VGTTVFVDALPRNAMGKIVRTALGTQEHL
jgi:acyl-coenzyme A synthetase/AMP-(fatty) acid ligase